MEVGWRRGVDVWMRRQRDLPTRFKCPLFQMPKRREDGRVLLERGDSARRSNEQYRNARHREEGTGIGREQRRIWGLDSRIYFKLMLFSKHLARIQNHTHKRRGSHRPKRGYPSEDARGCRVFPSRGVLTHPGGPKTQYAVSYIMFVRSL